MPGSDPRQGSLVGRVPRGPGPVAGACWTLGYAVVWVTGQRFSTDYLRVGWQMLPWDRLRDDPVGSVWYLHIQPPLWNLLMGSIARWSPFPTAVSIQLVMAAFGVILVTAVAATLARIGLRPVWAVGLTLFGTVDSDLIQFAFSPQYEVAMAAAIAVMAWAWSRGRDPQSSMWWLMGAGTAVVLTRSLYHPAWLALVLLGFVIVHRRRLRLAPTVACLLVPVVLVGGWLVKNQVVFGRPTMSSWAGMNLLRSIQPIVDDDQLAELVDEGKVSGVTAVGPFAPVDNYAAVMPPCLPKHDDPVLTIAIRPGVGNPPMAVANYNHWCLIPVYEQAGQDARAIIRDQPGRWLAGRWFSARMWLGDAGGASPSRSPVLDVISAWTTGRRVRIPYGADTSFWGHPYFGAQELRTHVAVFDVVVTVAILGAGVVVVIRRQRSGLRAPARAVIGFAAATWLYTFVVGVVGELGEQNRFRLMVDSLTTVIGITVLLWLLGRRSPRLAAACFVGPARPRGVADRPADEDVTAETLLGDAP